MDVEDKRKYKDTNQNKREKYQIIAMTEPVHNNTKPKRRKIENE